MTESPQVWRPSDAAEAAAMLAEANAGGLKVAIRGGASKGPEPAADRILDMTALSGVESYEPGELVLRAFVGTRVADIEALLADQGQMLAFEPPDFGPVMGGGAGKGTLGGMVAAGFSGPRRIAAGAVRDHLLGFDAVNGKGEAFKAGGPVVKNVTGYDLPKLMAGSWGSLAALTSVTLKVLPAPKTSLTLRLEGLTDQAACEVMSLAMGGAWSVSGAAHMPGGSTLLRLEGFAPSVQARAAGLRIALAGFGRAELVSADAGLWRDLRDLRGLAGRPIWRISAPPADGWKVGALLQGRGELIYDWAGGLIWFTPSESMSETPDFRALGASKRVLGASNGTSDQLTARVKTAFDPNNVLVGRL